MSITVIFWVVIVLALLGGGGFYSYGGPTGAYPYRSYAGPSLITIIVIGAILYFSGVIH